MHLNIITYCTYKGKCFQDINTSRMIFLFLKYVFASRGLRYVVKIVNIKLLSLSSHKSIKLVHSNIYILRIDNIKTIMLKIKQCDKRNNVLGFAISVKIFRLKKKCAFIITQNSNYVWSANVHFSCARDIQLF